MAAEIVITGADLAAWGVPTGVVGAVGLMFRRYFLDGIRRLRFLMGVVMLVVKGVQNAKPFFDSLEREEMSPLCRKIFLASRQLVSRLARLADELENKPERGETMSTDLIAALRELLEESRQHPKLIVPPDGGPPDATGS